MQVRHSVRVMGAIGAIFAAGLGLVVLLGRGLHALRESRSSEPARQAFVERWQPPVELKPELVFPKEVGGRRAEGEGTNAVFLSFVGTVPGLRVAYEKPGHPEISVFASRTGTVDAEAVQRRAREWFGGQGGTKGVVEVPGRVRLTASLPPQSVEMWTLHGWFFVFHHAGELEAEFVRMYLASITTRKG